MHSCEFSEPFLLKRFIKSFTLFIKFKSTLSFKAVRWNWCQLNAIFSPSFQSLLFTILMFASAWPLFWSWIDKLALQIKKKGVNTCRPFCFDGILLIWVFSRSFKSGWVCEEEWGSKCAEMTTNTIFLWQVVVPPEMDGMGWPTLA